MIMILWVTSVLCEWIKHLMSQAVMIAATCRTWWNHLSSDNLWNSSRYQSLSVKSFLWWQWWYWQQNSFDFHVAATASFAECKINAVKWHLTVALWQWTMNSAFVSCKMSVKKRSEDWSSDLMMMKWCWEKCVHYCEISSKNDMKMMISISLLDWNLKNLQRDVIYHVKEKSQNVDGFRGESRVLKSAVIFQWQT